MLILEVLRLPLIRNHLIVTDMKRKYCLVRTQGRLDVGSFVYVVWVGSSLRESTCLSLVEEFCKDCGWYFKVWSADVDSALMNWSKSVRTDGNVLAKPYTMHSLTIQECYDAIIDDAWVNIEKNHVMSPFEKFMRFRHNPSYLMAYHKSQCITPCSPSRRKYLSHRNDAYVPDGALCAMGVVGLLVLDVIVSLIGNSLFPGCF